MFLFFEQQKNPHFNSISLPPLWGNLYRKSTHLWRGRVNTPLPQPAQRKMWPCRLLGWWPVERGMGTGLFRAGLGGTLTPLIAQINLTVVAPLESHWSVQMLFLQERLPLRNVVRGQLPGSLSPRSRRTRKGQFPPHLPPSRPRCLANQVPASFLFF